MRLSEQERAERIAALNDAIRQRTGLPSDSVSGEALILWTVGTVNLPADVQTEIAERVRTFDDFDGENDPHGEHDFGAFEVEGAGRVFWKFDYYGPDRECLSEDPADPAKTFRVLTIMLAGES